MKTVARTRWEKEKEQELRASGDLVKFETTNLIDGVRTEDYEDYATWVCEDCGKILVDKGNVQKKYFWQRLDLGLLFCSIKCAIG